MVASLWFSFLLVFLSQVAELEANDAGTVMLSGQVADAIATPIVGWASDRTKFRFGRRKLWICIGYVLVDVSFFFVFSQCWACKSMHMSPTLFYSILASLFNVGWASVQVSHMALIPELTTDENDRTKLNGARYASCIVASLLELAITSVAFHLWGLSYKAFMVVSSSALVVGNIMLLLFLVVIREPRVTATVEDKSLLVNNNRRREETEEPGHVPQRKWYGWFAIPQFYLVAVIYMLSRIAGNLSQVYLPFFLEVPLLVQNKSFLAAVPAVSMLFGFLTSFGIKALNQRVGRIVCYILGTVFILISCIPMIFLPARFWWISFFLSAALGVGTTVVLVTATSMESDTVGVHTSTGAFAIGVWSFTDKIGNGILIKFMSPFTKRAFQVRLLNSVIPGGAAILGTLLTLTVPFYWKQLWQFLRGTKTRPQINEESARLIT